MFALMTLDKKFLEEFYVIMRHETTHQPVILLIDGSPAADNTFIKRWFEKSRFLTCETNDVFQALEEISDFTMVQRPDVILLEVESMTDGFQTVKTLTHSVAGQNEPPIFAFSENGKVINDCECFEGNLAQLEAKLNRMIPLYGNAQMTIAA
jgi:CheY-like chemotaxis protein